MVICFDDWHVVPLPVIQSCCKRRKLDAMHRRWRADAAVLACPSSYAEWYLHRIIIDFALRFYTYYHEIKPHAYASLRNRGAHAALLHLPPCAGSSISWGIAAWLMAPASTHIQCSNACRHFTGIEIGGSIRMGPPHTFTGLTDDFRLASAVVPFSSFHAKREAAAFSP